MGQHQLRARGLLALFLFSDVGPDDALTRLMRGSHLAVPEFLAPNGEEGTAADTEFWRPSALCLPVAQAIVAGHAAAAETSRRYNRMPTELARPASDSVVLCPFTADPADAPPFPARHADRRARRRYRLAA